MENHRGPVNYQNIEQGIEKQDDTSNINISSSVVKKESLENSEDYQETNPNSSNSAFTISETSKQSILNILDQIKLLTPLQKFLLFLKLDEEITNTGDPLKQSMNPLGSRSEVCRTISWIKTHLEEDPDISLPKQQVYDEYIIYCSQIRMKPLSQADFGKVMKQVYPNVKARRLGTRGNSRYCYSGLRNCTKLCIPMLPDLAGDKSKQIQIGESVDKGSSFKTASWLILKQWAEQQFNNQFSSLETLAFFLVVNCSVGVGSEAANLITSLSMNSNLDESESSKMDHAHRELQIHLQKKIHQKEEGVKERKRKCQSLKNPGGQAKASTTLKRNKPSMKIEKINASPSESGSTSSTNSPTEGPPVCDKYQDYNKSATLPDFNSFQKATQSDVGGGLNDRVLPKKVNNAPRLKPARQLSSLLNVRKGGSTKYKSIQQKPAPTVGVQLCDTAMYNPLPPSVAEDRSQNCQIICDKKEPDDFQDDLCLPRERLESISNVDKDAMDDYLGKSNSQHEEELSKYFNSADSANQIGEVDSTSSKMFQLRQLLQEHLKRNATNVAVNSENIINYNISNPSMLQNQPNVGPPDKIGSFEAPPEDNLRSPVAVGKRSHFNFMPISKPHSPNGRQSKCSSANASPFVSPRNTPVPRCRNYQSLGGLIQSNLSSKLVATQKVKKELDLSPDPLDSDSTNQITIQKNFYTLSPPPSPLVSNSKSMLQTLLNSNSSKLSYNSTYPNPEIKQENSVEMCHLLTENPGINFYRSHSVPLHQMIPEKNEIYVGDAFMDPMGRNEFADMNPIAEDKIGVTHIIDSLAEPGQIFSGSQETEYPVGRNLGRSQSFDIVNYSKNLSSRSVPSTPLPYLAITSSGPDEGMDPISHSYPSTPLISNESFVYNGADCLLNGQMIKNDDSMPQAQLADDFTNFTDYSNQSIINLAKENFSLLDKSLNMPDQNFNISIE